MPICSYLVIPDEGATDGVRDRLAAIPECEVVRAANREVLLLVTETRGLEEEDALRARVESMQGIQALLLTFGEIDPDADIADPISIGRARRRASFAPAREPGSPRPDATPEPGER